jgi:peptide/nickel transport system ATP-binding protein
MPLLEVADLAVRWGAMDVVDGVRLTLDVGRVHALVGESGSGKTLTALALVELLPWGLVAHLGRFLLDAAPVPDRANLRGRTIAVMPQDSSSALDPVMRVGAQLTEVLEHVGGLAAGPAAARAAELLLEVGFPEPQAVLRAYAHQLSGGMRQRVSLALTLSAGPRVLIVDEPTTALDAAARGGVLALLKQLAATRGLAVLVITHDLSAARAIADDVSVLYAGHLVEQGLASAVLDAPRHPYTAGLLSSQLQGRVLPTPISGSLPALGERPSGCRFRTRCARASPACEVRPALREVGERVVACHHPLQA